MTKTKQVAAPKTVTLAQVAKSLGWNPKTVRQYARRHRDVFPKPVSTKGWVYAAKDVPAIKKAITDGVTA